MQLPATQHHPLQVVWAFLQPRGMKGQVGLEPKWAPPATVLRTPLREMKREAMKSLPAWLTEGATPRLVRTSRAAA